METKDISYYRPLAYAAGIGSMLGSGIIVGLAATISVWQSGLGLTNGQVGIISGALTFAIAFGSLFGGRIAESIGLIKVFNWINLFYAIGAGIAVFAPNYITLLIGVVITGIASGTDLPISLTVVSRDSPDAKTSAKLVSSTQIFWQAGIWCLRRFDRCHRGSNRLWTVGYFRNHHLVVADDVKQIQRTP